VKYKIFIIVALFLSIAGCSSTIGGYIVPGESIDRNLVYKIEKNKTDERGLSEIILRQLKKKGLKVFIESSDTSKDYDVKIVYGGQWQWDMTWYLLNVDIRFYEKEPSLLLASAYSHRTSLVRKNPTEVVDEAISALFTLKQ
jgi:predicted CopG family antitoxin